MRQPLKTRLMNMALACICAALLPVTVGQAKSFQDHGSIITAARQHLEAQVEARHGRPGQVEMGRLDTRLRLAACSGKLETFMPPGARYLGNTTVGVRCPTGNAWSVYVSGQISLFGEVLVAAHPLARGNAVTEANVRLEKRDLATLPRGYYQSIEPVSGHLAKRHLAAGAVLTPTSLEAPRLVRRGERVTLMAGKHGFSVRSSGEALEDGSAGEQIRIRAKGSKRIVEGRVVSQGVVKVTL